MRQTAGDGIDPRGFSVGFLTEPATAIVMHEATLRANLQYGWVWVI